MSTVVDDSAVGDQDAQALDLLCASGIAAAARKFLGHRQDRPDGDR